MAEGKRRSLLLNVILVVAVALTVGIIGANIKTALIPSPQYREVDVKAVLKAINDAGLIPTEAKYYETLNTK